MAGTKRHKHKHRRDHVSVEIQDDYYYPSDEIVDSIEADVKEAFSLQYGRRPSIFKVHKKFRKMNKRAYTPEVASIGPFHRGKRHLRAMEPIKLMYMHSLLSRTEADEGTIEELELKTEGDWLVALRDCTKFVERKEEQARNCYFETIPLESDEFVRMLLIDGLFIIELFFRTLGMVKRGKYDPLFSKIGDLSSLARDLLLLENQIPMLILTGLFKRFEVNGEGQSGLILSFFNFVMPRENDILTKYTKCGHQGEHLLDFVANTFHPSPKNEEVVANKCSDYKCKHLLGKLFKKFHCSPEIFPEKTMIYSSKVMPNATEMTRAGIKFKKGSSKGSFLDIKYSKGELEIPHVHIHDYSELFFRNLIASEQCSDGKVTYFSSYASFMDSLIDSADDVQILRSEGIITNYLGSDEEVANLFNKLCCEVQISPIYLGTCEKINAYCSKNIHIWKASWKRDYCSSPCATISFLAAILLLLLTLTSTIFAIIPVVK